MELAFLNRLVPTVVTMRIKRATDLYGKWQDDEYVFTYIAGGGAEFFVDGKRFALKNGDMIVLPPKTAHIIAGQGEEPLLQYIFHFNFNEEAARELPRSVFAVTPTDAEKFDIRNGFLRMYKEYTDKRVGWSAMLSGLATTLLVPYYRGMNDSLRAANVPKREKSWLHIEKAVEYINHHLTQTELGNDEIAAAIDVSPNYLTKLFQDHLGFSLHAYVLNLRVEKAKTLMETVSITEAAEKSGFSSIHVFSKTFKRIVGMSPSEFLESSVMKAALLPNDDTPPTGRRKG